MTLFLILIAVALVVGALDAITTNRGISMGAFETTWMLPGHPTAKAVWIFTAVQIVVLISMALLGSAHVWPWYVCNVFPLMFILAHGVATWHNWAQAFPAHKE